MIASESVNIAAALGEMARSRPEARALACPEGHDRSGRTRYGFWTFRQLEDEVNELARGLEAVNIGRGVRTALMVKPGPEFFALTFALFRTGAVPVLVDPGMGIRSLGLCLDEAEPEAFIGIPKAQAARLLLGWARRTVRVAVTVGPRLPGGGWALDDVRRVGRASRPHPPAETRGDETAAILFTSGSTGPPKGAVYSHAIFAAQVELLRALYGIEPGEVDLCTFPLFALFAPALGMTAIVPEMDATRPARVDPRKILAPIREFGVTNLFGSPALLRRVGEYGAAHGETLPTLRRVISAGAPVSARILERFATLLGPSAQIFTPYGATEALPVCSIGSDEILGETRARTDAGAGVCVGRPVPGVRVAVIGITDEPLASWPDARTVPDGQVGEIAVQGPIVTRSYVHRPEANAMAKIAGDPGGVFHRMGDLGYRDDRGRIWFCGRKAHRVATAEGTLFTIPCEGVFNAHPEVLRTALVGVGPPGAMRPVLCVEPIRWPGRAVRDRLRRELLALGAQHAHTRSIATILFHRSFPVDIRHNAKIFRERLASWAARRLA